jgi:hypothetical protein
MCHKHYQRQGQEAECIQYEPDESQRSGALVGVHLAPYSMNFSDHTAAVFWRPNPQSRVANLRLFSSRPGLLLLSTNRGRLFCFRRPTSSGRRGDQWWLHDLYRGTRQDRGLPGPFMTQYTMSPGVGALDPLNAGKE